MAEFSSPISEETTPTWILFVDGTHNHKSNDVGIMIEELDGLLIKQSLKFEFKVSNNQTKYEVFVMILTLKMRASRLNAIRDS